MIDVKDEVLVSIIVPIYNVENYLEKCVDSIVAQTYKNLQILLIDDGSKDLSGYICDNLAQKDRRIEVFHKENEGLGLTRNYGLKHAFGKYVMFLDSDDYIDINTVKVMTTVAEEENAELVISGFIKITDDKKILYREVYKKEIFVGKTVKNELLPRMIGSLPYIKDSIFTMACGKLYRLESIVRNNILFPSERNIQSEDLAFQLDFIPGIVKAVVLEEQFYYYRKNLKSLTMVYKKNRFEESKKVYKYVMEKIEEKNLPSDTYLRADKMMFVQLRSILRQEFPDYSGRSWRICIKRIKEILDDNLVKKIVNEYPVKLLAIEQKIFIYLIKFRCKILLILALRIKGRREE